MSFIDYKKTAVNLMASLKENDNIISLSSSCEELDLLPVAKELSRAVICLGKSVALLDARIGEGNSLKIAKTEENAGEATVLTLAVKADGEELKDAEVIDIISTAKTKGDILFVVTEPVVNSASALFASKAQAFVLVEQKKKSRTDKIEECLTELNILKVTPLGFVLV